MSTTRKNLQQELLNILEQTHLESGLVYNTVKDILQASEFCKERGLVNCCVNLYADDILVKAVAHNSLDLINLLIENGANPSTALPEAISKEQFHIVEGLLLQGAETCLGTTTALQIAKQHPEAPCSTLVMAKYHLAQAEATYTAAKTELKIEAQTKAISNFKLQFALACIANFDFVLRYLQVNMHRINLLPTPIKRRHIESFIEEFLSHCNIKGSGVLPQNIEMLKKFVEKLLPQIIVNNSDTGPSFFEDNKAKAKFLNEIVKLIPALIPEGQMVAIKRAVEEASKSVKSLSKDESKPEQAPDTATRTVAQLITKEGSSPVYNMPDKSKNPAPAALLQQLQGRLAM